MHNRLVAPLISFFNIIYKSTAYNYITTGCGIITGKKPVAGMLWARCVKVFNGLRYEFLKPGSLFISET
ncbi:MAG: hypothetical protein PHR81_02400, partial [Bacteroidales bacterium]|nr:hypothetical protein [Bacteroidales bacterium]